jgi:hypothetical protein
MLGMAFALAMATITPMISLHLAEDLMAEPGGFLMDLIHLIGSTKRFDPAYYISSTAS